jgi:hypothetical protein
MSDETMIQTPDSSAGASDAYGIGNAILDEVRSAADYDSFSTPGVNDGADVLADNSAYDWSEDQSHITGNDDNNRGPIPYDRFKEVNEQARSAKHELDQWNDIIQEFRQQGFNSAADLRKAAAQREATMQEESIRTRYRELEQQELVDPHTANLQLEAELEKFRYQQAMSQVSHYMIQQERQAAVTQYPLAQQAPAMVESLISRGVSPQEAVKITHEQIANLRKSIQSDVTKQVAQGRNAPMPTGRGDSAQPVINGNMPQGGRMSLSALMGIGRNRNSV